MRIVNKKTLVTITCMLVIIEISSLYLMYKTYQNKNVKLDTVSLIDEIEVPEMFAIMLEQSDGTYKESTSSDWPSSDEYIYDSEQSGCIDSNGNKLENSINYDADINLAMVDTDSTANCYLYFDAPNYICDTKTNLGECVLTAKTTGLNSELVAELYRYQGTTADNYICFNTKDYNKCVNNPDLYMYRIIGINENGQLKLIKKEALNENLQWNTSYLVDINWVDSLLYSKINGTAFLNNQNLVSNVWNDKIATTSWKYGNFYHSNSTGTGLDVYNAEMAFVNAIDAKIGLMYIHDYYLAYDNNIKCRYYSSDPDSEVYATCKSSWIHLSNNDTTLPNSDLELFVSHSAEYLMGYYGKECCINDENFYSIWNIRTNGGVETSRSSWIYSVRPVFYLNKDLKYIFGKGTLDNPFIIS